jgi:ABC-type transport system substrate-binding protein
LLLVAVSCAVALAAGAADPAKVLRIAQFDIDTLDPQQYADDPSFQVVMAIFEPLYEWDYLSPTPKLTPLTGRAAGSDRGRPRVDDQAEARRAVP